MHITMRLHVGREILKQWKLPKSEFIVHRVQGIAEGMSQVKNNDLKPILNGLGWVSDSCNPMSKDSCTLQNIHIS